MLDDLTPHYADDARAVGADESELEAARRGARASVSTRRFLRMWEFYLSYCEGGFEERAIGLVQAVFENRETRRPSLLGEMRAA